MGSGTEQDRAHRRDEAVAFDLWIRVAFKQEWGLVVREPLPQELLTLLDATAADH